MRVKIGDTWYNSNKQPICIHVNEDEQQQIANMDRAVGKNGKYAVFPDDDKTTAEQKLEWMKS